MRTLVKAALSITVVLSAMTLSGCSLLGPQRDSNGRVTATTEIDSTTLLRGDCFSFVDGSDLARANVMPCSQPHTYLVIDAGTLNTTEVGEAGGLQNAVSAACASTFDAYKSRAPDSAKPEQQFIVSPQEKDGVQFTLYLCVATTKKI